jgi:hypothetical protein
MRMMLSKHGLWKFVDGSATLPSEEVARVDYNEKETKAFALLCEHLTDAQLAHIQYCDNVRSAWEVFCGVHEAKTIGNKLFLRRFTIKMQEGDDMLVHINTVKALTDQLRSIEVNITYEDVYMVLLMSLPHVCKDTAHIANSLEEGAMLWHERLGHFNMASLKELDAMVDGMNLKEVSLCCICEGCVNGKHQRTSFPKDGATRASQLLEIVHTDVCGPMRTTSHGGARYFFTFIDDFSRKTHVYLLKAKGEVFEKFKQYKALVENEIGHKIKVLRSDNEGKFLSKKFDAILAECGIQ